MTVIEHAQPDLVFDPFDPDTVRSPYDTYRRLRDEAPLHFVPFAAVATHEPNLARRAGGFYVLSRFADVFAAARDTATFSSAHGLSIDGSDIEALGLVPTIVMMDQPEHTAFRRLVSRGFTPRQVAQLAPDIEAFVTQRIDAMEAGLREHGSVDLIDELAGPLPSFVVATYLGVPDADRDRFDRWSLAIVAANAEGDVLGRAQDAVGELYAYFTDLIEKRRRDPGDDMISELVHATLDDEPMSIEGILGYAFVMIAGGNDTVTGLVGGAAAELTYDRDQRRVLLDEPGLIAPAVDELLRMTSPVQGLSRHVLRDVEIHGRTVPAGARVHLLYGSANRDPREFGADAELLDVRRRPPRIMSFSSGPHHCLGASAARLQGRVALEQLLRRFPDFEVDTEAAAWAPGAFVRRYQSLPFVATV